MKHFSFGNAFKSFLESSTDDHCVLYQRDCLQVLGSTPAYVKIKLHKALSWVIGTDLKI